MSFKSQKTSSNTVSFSWPGRIPYPQEIFPLFLPFAGCPVRCVFCAQETQTGTSPAQPLPQVLDTAEAQLRQRAAASAHAPEVAFFGGTFTALTEKEFTLCLTAFDRWRGEGLVSAARCSTRPDAPMRRLTALRQAGFTTVELGIQSYDDAALAAVQRGYDGTTARAACEAVHAAGLQLGVQLLPGMPGVDAQVFIDDVRTALEHGADFLRFYPCLVLEGTALAALWREGRFTPWPLDMTVAALAEGWLLAQAVDTRVIRMGLAPEAGLAEHILAGPHHPGLGGMVMGEALCQKVQSQAQGRTLRSLLAPDHCRGYFWGQGNALRPRWRALGLTTHNVHWHRMPQVDMYF